MNYPDKKSQLGKQTLSVIRDVLGDPEGFTALHEPTFRGNEWKYVKDCLDSGWVSSVGKYVDRFEDDLAHFTGAKRAIATSSGTSALHICMLLAGVQSGDEVLVPALTFVATVNPVRYIGAIPHFVDCEESSFGIDPEKLEVYLSDVAEIREGYTYNRHTGRKISALVPVHLFGHPCRIDELVELASRYRLKVIEDAAESLGSTWNETQTGVCGDFAAVSFNGNKTITTGGGGAILTNNKDQADLAKHLTTTAKVSHKWEFNHDQVAFNYRLPNINAALGCAQLEQLPDFIKAKRALAASYQQAFKSVEGIQFVDEPEGASSNYWLNSLILDKGREEELENILELTNAGQMMTRPAWNLMPDLTMFQDFPKSDCSVAHSVRQRLINIPSSVSLFKQV